jgi:streptogramin lyase
MNYGKQLLKRGEESVMKNRLALVAVMLVGIGIVAHRDAHAQAIPGPSGVPGGAILTGTIRSVDGNAMEGVAVSARTAGSRITTSVFTDAEGVYVFPPLANGNYRVWAQTVGYSTGHAEAPLNGSGVVRRDFSLGTASIGEITRQMSGADWFASLPESTIQERRIKQVFKTSCTGCHLPSYVLQNRFDKKGWMTILDYMKTFTVEGDRLPPDRGPLPIIDYHQNDLAEYLAKYRGPDENALKPVIVSRPKGDATLAVITEYVIDPANTPGEYPAQDGSDWSQGTPTSSAVTKGTHDAEMDLDGNIWVVDSFPNARRTYARIDAKTGEVKNFKQLDSEGKVRPSHGIRRDDNGILWFDLRVQAENDKMSLARLDPATEEIKVYTPPEEMSGVGGSIDIDGKGKVWASARTGALQFDPDTEKFTEFKSLQFRTEQGTGNTYGVAADSQGNGYWAQMAIDVVGRANFATGEVTEIKMPPRREFMEIATEEDRRLYAEAGSIWNSAVPWAQGPRRLGGDRTGDAVWVANWWGENLAKIDIHTSEVTQYPVPSKHSGPYAAVVDKNHIVWVNMMNNDSVGRFDPKIEEWTEYMLPTRGAESRHIAVLDKAGSTTVVVPYWRASKVARLQFRTRQDIERLKAQVNNASQDLQEGAR